MVWFLGAKFMVAVANVDLRFQKWKVSQLSEQPVSWRQARRFSSSGSQTFSFESICTNRLECSTADYFFAETFLSRCALTRDYKMILAGD